MNVQSFRASHQCLLEARDRGRRDRVGGLPTSPSEPSLEWSAHRRDEVPELEEAAAHEPPGPGLEAAEARPLGAREADGPLAREDEEESEHPSGARRGARGETLLHEERVGEGERALARVERDGARAGDGRAHGDARFLKRSCGGR